MTVIRDRAKKKIAKILKAHGVFDLEEEILSIKELAIVDRETKIPFNDPYGTCMAEINALNILIEAGWVKEIK